MYFFGFDGVKVKKEEQLKILRQGVEVWNKWREENPNIVINLSDTSLYGNDLRGTDLSEANLSGANLNGANLSYSLLECANLRDSCLMRIQALGTSFQGANLTGACIRDWNINSQTNLQQIACDYIYLAYSPYRSMGVGRGFVDRRPVNRNFEPGEFEELFKVRNDIIDLIFTENLNWSAFASSFREIQEQYIGSELGFQGVVRKGDRVVVQVSVPTDIGKSEFEVKFMKAYYLRVKTLEGTVSTQQKMLDRQDKTIDRQESTIVHLTGNLNNLTDTINSLSALVAIPQTVQNFSGNIYGVAGRVQGDQNIQSIENIDITLQKMLDALALAYPNAPKEEKQILGKYAIKELAQQNPTFKARLLGALDAGGSELLKQLINSNPFISVSLETFRGWVNPPS